MKKFVKQSSLVIIALCAMSTTTMAQVAADATNTTNAQSGSTALSGSQSGVNSSIRGAAVGVGNAAGDLANTQGQQMGQQQGNIGYNGQTQGQQQGQSQNGANNGQALSVSGAGVGNNYSTNVSHAADLSKAVGQAFAPALTTTLTETCMGSTSMGGGFSGGSFSFGTTWRDHACVRRLDAREIRSYGDIQAAKEIMCDSDLVRDAFKRVGRPCAEDGGSYVAVSQAPAPTPEVAAPEVVAPVATEVPVKDDQDANAQHSNDTLKKADAAREAFKEKYGW
jgi:hypothetical protein